MNPSPRSLHAAAQIQVRARFAHQKAGRPLAGRAAPESSSSLEPFSKSPFLQLAGSMGDKLCFADGLLK